MLEPDLDTEFLFDISSQIKDFYETAVIFLTRKDYSDPIFNALCSIRTTLREDDKKRLVDLIVDFHLQWLHAINDLEDFKNRLEEGFPRDEVFEAISFTINALSYRLKYFQRYVEKYRSKLSNANQANILAEVEIIEEMHSDVTNMLQEKLKCFKSYVCFEEFRVHVNDAIDELLHWIDKIHDGLAIKLSKYINVHVPHLQSDLTKTLQQIVDEMQSNRTPSILKLLEELKLKGNEIGSLIRCTAGHDLELNKVYDKIGDLEERIKRLESEKVSAAVMALQHKKEYLEKRVNSLEKLKTTLKSVQNSADIKLLDETKDEELCVCEDFFQLRIFNHLLPSEQRERLVTELCYLWDTAIFGNKRRQSMISILSAADIKEEFTDELGTFYIDEYSRKIYKLPEDDTLFQPNEQNKLVPVTDDLEHVYFYDDCGRYFIDAKTKQRVYKCHATASEYMMDASGVLLKVKEERDGVTFYYDHYGRYYIDPEGKHIYRDEDHQSEYENDGLGNLVRIRSLRDIFQPCPDDAHVTEDFKYLRQNVGAALRRCIADVLLQQPADPIKYLSMSLVTYRENIELKERRSREKEELNSEREYIAAEERAAAERAAMEAALLLQGGSEASYDSNMYMYTSMRPEDPVSVGGASSTK